MSYRLVSDYYDDCFAKEETGYENDVNFLIQRLNFDRNDESKVILAVEQVGMRGNCLK